MYIFPTAWNLSCLTEILELLKGAILSFNNRNLNFNPLSTKISNKNFPFISTLKVNQEQSEIILLIFKLKVANYGNFIQGIGN